MSCVICLALQGEYDAAMAQYLETLPPAPPPKPPNPATTPTARRTGGSTKSAGASKHEALEGDQQDQGGISGRRSGQAPASMPVPMPVSVQSSGMSPGQAQLQQELYLEPSYVIRRFLDAQRTASLAMYLEQLHERVSQRPQASRHRLSGLYVRAPDTDCVLNKITAAHCKVHTCRTAVSNEELSA